jgi:hypothetical protein
MVAVVFVIGAIATLVTPHAPSTASTQPASASKVADSPEARRASEEELAADRARLLAGAVAEFNKDRAKLLKESVQLGQLVKQKDINEAESLGMDLSRRLESVRGSDLAKDKGLQTIDQRTKAGMAAVQKYRLAFQTADASRDIEVVRSSWTTSGFGTIAMWQVTLKNTNEAATFRDISHETRYSARSGTAVGNSSGTILDVLKPGQTKRFEVNDGFVNQQASGASFKITGGVKE